MKAEETKWIYSLDNLRTFIILLVVVFHVAMAYMVNAPQWWYVVDPKKSLFFDLFILINDVFMMPAIFFIAGYFALQSLVKEGSLAFLKDKLIRLFIPWVIGVLFLAPVITYMTYLSRSDNPPGYLMFWTTKFFTQAYQQAHYWFLGVLMLFFLVLAVIYGLNKSLFKVGSQVSKPSVLFFSLRPIYRGRILGC